MIWHEGVFETEAQLTANGAKVFDKERNSSTTKEHPTIEQRILGLLYRLIYTF